jgi:hypothetical protein
VLERWIMLFLPIVNLQAIDTCKMLAVVGYQLPVIFDCYSCNQKVRRANCDTLPSQQAIVPGGNPDGFIRKVYDLAIFQEFFECINLLPGILVLQSLSISYFVIMEIVNPGYSFK